MLTIEVNGILYRCKGLNATLAALHSCGEPPVTNFKLVQMKFNKLQCFNLLRAGTCSLMTEELSSRRDTRSRSEQIKPDVSLLQAQMVCMEQELIALRQENEQLKSEQNEMAIKLMDAEDNVVNLKGELLEVLQVVDRLTGGIKPNR
eukprot:15197-Heterococcus_DN1.PRE.3